MTPSEQDFTILYKFEFTYQPVGMKFLLNKPEGMEKLDKSIPICQMFREAQDRHPFYARAENFACVDRLLLGFMNPEPFYEAGQIGAKENIYREARANRRIYQYIEKIKPGTVRHVAFSPVAELPFTPDLLIFTARPDQAEVILRALSYSTGKPLTAKMTPVLMCAWLFIYPFMTGNVNYTVTGLGYGMKSKKMLPEGLVLITVPYDQIPMLLDNLSVMEWVLPMFTMADEEKAEFSAKVMGEIQQEYREGE